MTFAKIKIIILIQNVFFENYSVLLAEFQPSKKTFRSPWWLAAGLIRIVLETIGNRVMKLSEYMVPWTGSPEESRSCNLLKNAILDEVFRSVTSMLPSVRFRLLTLTVALGISCRDSKPDVQGPVTVWGPSYSSDERQ